MSTVRKCLLRCVKTGREIFLVHGKEVTIGRGPQTEITDTKVSKCQVSLIADIEACSIFTKCLGSNPSGINNKKLKKNDSNTLQHGDQLEVLLGRYFYKVEFVPPPASIDRNSKLLSKKNNCYQDDTNGIPVKRPRMSLDQNGSKNDTVCKRDLWEDIDHGKLLIFTKAETRSSCKIAAYDMDGTLILTKSGKVFPQNRDDWNLANSAVKPKLKKLFDDGYKIVIFTNQAGISRGKTSVPDFKYKIERIAEALEVPVQVFVATSEDIYRKPAPGMWDVLVKKKNSGICIDKNESFYVGDAAGREQNWMPKKKKDFSSADRLFAMNIGLRFQTPEAHFLNQPEGKYKLPEFQPSNLDENVPICSTNLTSKTKEVIILVGSPGSGKTFFVSTYLLPAGYAHVNRDKLGSWQRCVSKMESALSDNKSVVIDNTNPDKASRKRYLDVAAKLNVTCRCFIINTTIEHSIHNNKFRQLVHEDHVYVNEIMINSYRKKLEPPTEDEGFAEIVKINFVPKFDDPEKERLYKMFLV